MIFLLVLTSATAINTTQLKEYYSFDKGISTIIEGYNGNSLNSIGSSIGTEVTGQYIKALNLNTNQSYYVFLNLDEHQNITLNFWLKVTDKISGYAITMADNTSILASNNYLQLRYVNSTHTGSMTKYYNPTSESYTPVIYNDSQFHMYSIVWQNGTNIKYYIDGILNDTITYATLETMPNSMNYLILGEKGYGTSTTSNITLDEFSIWNYLLSPSEVTELYANQPLIYENVFTGNTTCNVVVDAGNTESFTTTTSPTILQMNDNYYLYPLASLGTPYSSQATFTITGQQGYYGVICNYTEVQPLNKTFNNIINASLEGMTNNCGRDNILGILNPYFITSLYLNATCDNTKTIIPINNASTYNDKTIEFTTFTATNSTSKIDFKDSFGFDIITVYQVLNGTEMCYYDGTISSSNTIFCFYYNLTSGSQNPSGAILNFIDINYGSGTYKLRIWILDSDNHFYGRAESVPFSMTTAQINYMAFETDKTLWIDDLYSTELRVSNPIYKSYNGTITTVCGYGLQTSGMVQMRVYTNTINNSFYEVCYGSNLYFRTQAQREGDISNIKIEEFTGMTQKERRILWSVILTFGIALIAGIGLGIPTRNGPVAILSFLFMVMAGLVFFGIIGWMTPIFAILIGLLDTIFIVVAFKMLFFSTND